MKLAAKSTKVSCSPNEHNWGGSFSENGLFLLLEVEKSQEKKAPEYGQEILDLFLTKITNYKERNLQVIGELLDWAKEIKGLHTATLGFLKEDVLHLGNFGTGEVILRRKDKCGRILVSRETSSGKVEPGDILLFSSKTFLESVGKEKQTEMLRQESISETAEEAYKSLLTSPRSKGAAALVVKLEHQNATSGEEKSFLFSPQKNYKNIIKDKLQQIISTYRRESPSFPQDAEEIKSKKTLLTIAAFLIFLLIASIFLNINHSQSVNKKNLFKKSLDLVSHQYNEAVNLIDLNPARARILLSDSKISLSQILNEFPKNSKEYKDITDWLANIAEKEIAAFRIFKFTTVPVFFDLGLIKSGGEGTKISLYQKTAVVLDSKNKTVYSLSLDTKKAAILAGSEVIKEAQTISVHGKSVYLLNNDGIIQIDIPTKNAQIAVKPDSEWGEIKELVSFAGNIYVLDRKNNAIWKYNVQSDGFSARTSYLSRDVSVSFEKATKMVIDGSIWVLLDGSPILKFTSGHGDAFSFKGLADNISPDLIFTSDESKNLYILDKQTPRILVFDKDGEYQSQYQWDELQKANDLIVSEEEKKIFILISGKIYAMDIK